VLDHDYDADVFVLLNKWNLPEVDLDAKENYSTTEIAESEFSGNSRAGRPCHAELLVPGSGQFDVRKALACRNLATN
jgi:hypothetical protein